MISIPTYLAYISPRHGFGVFPACAIAERNFNTFLKCVATYGGMACRLGEELHQTETYQLDGTLREKVDANGQYVSSFCTCAWHNRFRIICRPAVKFPTFYIDGSDMRAGDGKFINHTCNPNVEVDCNYIRTDLPPDPTRSGSPVPQQTTTALIQPTWYDRLHVTFCSHHSDIAAHEQLLLSYERPRRLLISVDENLGGSFPAEECRCGSVFCCGDILRRLAAGKLLPSDTYFFTSTAPELKIRIHAIRQANKAWYESAAASSAPTDHAKILFLKARKIALPDRPRISTVYSYYMRTKFRNRQLSEYLKDLTGLDGKWDDGEASA